MNNIETKYNLGDILRYKDSRAESYMLVEALEDAIFYGKEEYCYSLRSMTTNQVDNYLIEFIDKHENISLAA